MTPQTKFVDVGFQMHVRVWGPDSAETTKRPFLLVHGLASNVQTWDGVAAALSAKGHPVIAIDQRGHGLSEKLPVEAGYDFATVSADLHRLLDTLDWDAPIMAGQSWGGNVMLAFGAIYPGRAAGFVYVDGGFLDLSQRAPVWEEAYEQFKPPTFTGVLRSSMFERMRQYQPEWTDDGINATLANFELLPDGTVTPWLTLDRHMTIFRSLWEQRPQALYPNVNEPVLICPAATGEHDAGKIAQVQAAIDGLANSTVVWFDDTAHDIHVHRPTQLATTMLNWAKTHDLYDTH